MIIGLFLSLNLYASQPATLVIKQQDVANMVLNKSLKSNEINLRYELEVIKPYLAAVPYDWTLTAESGIERDRSKSYSIITSPDYERYKTSISLQKNLLTGTQLNFELSRNSQKQMLNATSAPPLTLDNFGMSIQQSLWRNSFGNADRSGISSVELENKATSLLRVNELEELVLEALRLFWNTYVAQESFKESLAAKERYEKLVAAVKRKSGFGYSSPGELPQVLAEYEVRIQNVKTAGDEYLKNLENLTTLLNLEPKIDIQLQISEDIPIPPSFIKSNLDERRIIRSQTLKTQSAEEAYHTSVWKQKPLLDLVGKYYSTGLADKTQDSTAELLSESANKYYLGLKFQTTFGSNIQEQDVLNKRSALELEKIKLSRGRNEVADKDLQTERRVTTTYNVALSTKEQLIHRDRATQDLAKSYQQGRTDIGVYIEALNKYFTAQVSFIRAIGDYQISLNELAAQRDELVR